MRKLAENTIVQSSLVHNPFSRLKGLVKEAQSTAAVPGRRGTQKETVSTHSSEEELFMEAMSGVNPLKKNRTSGENIEIKQVVKLRQANKTDYCLYERSIVRWRGGSNLCAVAQPASYQKIRKIKSNRNTRYRFRTAYSKKR